MNDSFWEIVYLCKECRKVQKFTSIHGNICLHCGAYKSHKEVSGKWVSTSNWIDKFFLRNKGFWEYREHE